MIADRIRELLSREPFDAFRIGLSSGDSLDVRNPDLVALMKAEAFVASDREDSYRIVPYLHIAAVETIAGRRSGGELGTTPRRRGKR